jgi:hypothetical protein
MLSFTMLNVVRTSAFMSDVVAPLQMLPILDSSWLLYAWQMFD